MPLSRGKLVFPVLFLLLGFVPLENNCLWGRAGVAWAEDQPAVSETATKPQPPVQKETVAKTVTAIEVQGNKSISSNTIISKMKIKVGIPYQENIINDDLKRLYLLGYFSDIKIDTAAYKEGLKIIITVAERPVIEKITFSGFRRVNMSAEKQKTSLKSKEGQYLDYPNLAEDIQTIKKLYEKIGYTEAKIEYKTDINKETNKAKLIFEAVEGGKVRIKHIFIEGNKNFRTPRLLKLIKTKRAWLFNAGVLKEDVLREDIERIKSFYHKNGFADVTVEYEVKRGAKKSTLDIVIKIEEGKKYLVGSVFLKGNKDISEKEILEKVKEAVPDKVYSQEAVKQDIANIQGLYFDRGYISAQVQEAISMEPLSNRVNIVYDIIENNITYVDKIKIRGNVKTRDVVIRRELRIKPGERFDGEKLRRSKERLQNLGFFEDISYDTEDTAVSDKKDLIVDVKETKTGAFSFGGGYSTVDKLVGFVEIEQKNFDWKNFPYFTGAGQDLKFRASLGSLSEGFDLSFTEPWIFDYPVSFGFDLYKRKHKRDSDVGYGYDENVTGGDLRLGKDLSEYVKGNATYRYESIDIGSVSDTASQDLRDESGVNRISSVELGLSFDNRNNIFDPVKGNYLSGAWSVAGGPLGGNKDFWKFYSRASHYTPLFLGSVFETRVRAGLADPYGDTKKVPIYERFFAGGADSIRGYRERKIGPLDASGDPLGGQSLLIGNLEYKYPLVSFIKMAVFYDIGNVWSKMNDFGSGGLKSGYGFGFRIKTPIGPILLDYGIPLNKEPGQERKGNGRLHFNMSHGF
jgi:outer membrane protein insertion porin family